MAVVSRAEWGARAWRKGMVPGVIPVGQRTEFMIHWHGGRPPHPRGAAMAKAVEQIHYSERGWAGVGYAWMVGDDGIAFEGRGWPLVGAHCPGHNVTAYGCYLAVGEGQTPTTAALATARTLYAEACERTGRALRRTWHGEDYGTECPGRILIQWVKDGMPAPAGHDQGDDMPTPREIADALLDTPLPVTLGLVGSDGLPLTHRWAAVRSYQALVRIEARLSAGALDVEALAAALAAQGVTADGPGLADALADALAARLQS